MVSLFEFYWLAATRPKISFLSGHLNSSILPVWRFLSQLNPQSLSSGTKLKISMGVFFGLGLRVVSGYRYKNSCTLEPLRVFWCFESESCFSAFSRVGNRITLSSLSKFIFKLRIFIFVKIKYKNSILLKQFHFIILFSPILIYVISHTFAFDLELY